MIRKCNYCGKEYKADAYRVSIGRNIYCGRKCSYKHRGEMRQKRVQIICQRCNKSFCITQSMFDRGKGKYCSRECQYPKHIRNCEICGNTFRCSPTKSTLYCSAKCRKIGKSKKSKEAAINGWNNEDTRRNILNGIKRRSKNPKWKNAKHFQRGDKHPNYKGNRSAREKEMSRYTYKKWRKSVFKRDNYTCQKCNVRGGKLVAHHVKEWSKYPELRLDVSNGVTVCESCHNIIHGKTIHKL